MTSLSLNCTFKIQNSYWGEKYACVVEHIKTSLADRQVSTVVGTHRDGKTNDDVKKVLIEHQFCPYLPTNLGAHFKNLEILYVMKSNLSRLTDDDLNGLTKLKTLDVSYNPITRLHKNFFKNHESIETISFYECELKFIEKGALEPLVNLKEGHFQFNVCIDFRGDDVSKLPDMHEEIKEYCEDPHRSVWNKKENEYSVIDYELPWEHIDTATEEDSKIAATGMSYNDSFVRSNAYLIISFLAVVIASLVGFLYRINAFNRQNWR